MDLLSSADYQVREPEGRTGKKLCLVYFLGTIITRQTRAQNVKTMLKACITVDFDLTRGCCVPIGIHRLSALVE